MVINKENLYFDIETEMTKSVHGPMLPACIHIILFSLQENLKHRIGKLNLEINDTEETRTPG